MKGGLPTGRNKELDNIGFLCLGLAIPGVIGLGEWISSAVSAQPQYAMDYSRLAQFAAFAVAPFVVGIGLYRRSFLFGYVGGLVLAVASLLYLVLSLGGSASTTAFDWLFLTTPPLALLLLLPMRYKALFAGTSAGPAERARRTMPE